MRTSLFLFVAVVAAAAALYFVMPKKAAQAQATGYFDVSKVTIPDFKEPDWGVRQDGPKVQYLCINPDKCPPPTAVEVKGVNRADPLPAAFETGDLTPAKLMAQGQANAARTGSRFLKAEAITIGGIKGVHMEASAMGGKVFFVTRWLGQGNQLLDVKATSGSLDAARQLIDTATTTVVPQVFGQK